MTRGVDGPVPGRQDDDSDNGALADELLRLPTPYVMVDRVVDELDCNKVLFDHEQGGYMATRYLLDQGHRRIACIVNAAKSVTGRKRLAGYRRALDEAGVALDPALVLESEYYIASAYAASEGVLASDATAVFASSDNIALGLLKRLHEAGLRIPADYSVVATTTAPRTRCSRAR